MLKIIVIFHIDKELDKPIAITIDDMLTESKHSFFPSLPIKL